MPKLAFSVPKYRRYGRKNLAVVNFGRGKDVYLGPWRSKRSRELYDQLIALWLQNGRALPDDALAQFCGEADLAAVPQPAPRAEHVPPSPPAGPPVPTLRELAEAYNAHARVYYRKAGRSTREAEQIAEALAVAVEHFGEQPADQFGPRRFQLTRDAMIAKGWSRPYINKQCGRIKRACRWAVTQEMIPAAVCGALREVEGLKKGRTPAPETEHVEPVARAVVDATLPHLNPIVADMVRLQLETGMRPGEVRELRPRSVDRGGAVWAYRPESHKTEHQAKNRVVFIGPKGQAILRPYLLRGADEYCFSPIEAVRKMREQRASDRRTPLSCGNRTGTNRQVAPRRRAGRKYSKDSYTKAIRRACQSAQLEPWQPNQLRHTRATEVRAQFGLEAAQVILGHSQADVTQIYAERDEAKAREVMAQVG